MDDKLFVKEWRKFQHYKKRDPIWIKLHRSLLDDEDFHRLPLASRALAPMLWLLAAKSEDGSIPRDPESLAFKLRRTKQEVCDGLEPLIESGFLTLASNVLATCKQDASLEKEKEKEKEKKKGASQNPNLSLREMALGIIQEAVIPSSVALEEIVSKSIQAYGKDMELTDEDAATWILERVREYRAAGKRVTRFWFENGGYLPDLKPAEKQKYSVADEMRRQLGIVQ